MQTRLAGGYSIPGPARPHNDDAIYYSGDGSVLAVADGVSGFYQSGEASRYACECVQRAASRLLTQGASGLRRLLQEIETDFRLRFGGGEHPKGGTTLTIAVLWPQRVFIGAIGDSPVILVQSDQERQLFPDPPDPASPRPRSTPGFLGSGIDNQWVVRQEPFADEDRLILVSDGISGVLRNEEIAGIARRHQDPELVTTHILQAAIRRGSEDNCSCIASIPTTLITAV